MTFRLRQLLLLLMAVGVQAALCRGDDGQRQASPLAEALRRPSVTTHAAKEEVREFATRRVPDVRLGNSRAAWLEQAAELRKQFLSDVVFRGTAAAWRDAPSQVHWHDEVIAGSGYRIRKFRYEALPGFWIPALLYEPTELREKMPVVINPNGHHRGGKAMPYKQRRCINLARRGILAYSLEFIDMGQLHTRENRHNRLVQLDLCGTSGLAPFYLALSRAVDVALDHPHVDPERVAVAGLSGGGWQSILLAALDTRVALANPVAGYCSMHARIRGDNNIGDAEQIPSDMCTVADYTHLTAMVAPRPLLLTYNAQDNCCFVPDQVLPRLERIGRSTYQLCGAPENFSVHINHDPGTHNFDQDNREAFYRQIHAHLIPQASAAPVEMTVDDSEIHSEEALAVPMPEKNLTLHQLALRLSESLPEAPEGSPQLRRDRLTRVVRHQTYKIQDELIDESQSADCVIRRLRFRLGTDWTLPAVEFRPPEFEETCVVFGDGGKQALITEVDALLAAGRRVVAVDLLGFGEADAGRDPASNDDVMLLLLAVVGERPLGIQSGQLAAVCDWANATAKGGPADVVAVGPRCSTIAMVAAALHPESIGTLTTHRARASLRELIEENLAAEDAPEQFCFGLLNELDMPQLHELIGADRVIVK